MMLFCLVISVVAVLVTLGYLVWLFLDRAFVVDPCGQFRPRVDWMDVCLLAGVNVVINVGLIAINIIYWF